MIPAVEIFANMLFSGLAIHFMNSFLRRGGRAAAYKMVLGWAAYFVTVTFLTYPKGFEGLSAISYGVILFVYASFALKGEPGEKLVGAIIWNVIVTISSISALMFTNVVFNRNLSDLWDVDIVIRLGELFSVFFLRLILIKLVVIFKTKEQIRGLAGIRFGVIIGLFYFCMWVNIIAILMSVMNPDRENRYMWILLLMMEMTVCVMLLFYLYERWSKQEQERIRSAYLERMNEEQQKYIGELLKSNEIAKILKHDLKRYFYVLNMYLSNGEYEECKKYLNDMRDMSGMMTDGDTDSDSVHTIMENRRTLCERDGIPFQYSILGNWDKIDEMDLCVLLLNMMDNAVEAELKENEKDIKIEICNYKGYLKIMCKNKIKESVLKTNPALRTSKVDKDHHGIGLLSIRKIAEKYDGSQVTVEENGYFINTVFLRNI